MLRTFLKVFFSIVAVFFIYLLIVNWSVYYRIGKVGLKASDNRHSYVFNEQITNSKGLVYVALGDSLTAGVGVSEYEQSYPYLVSQKIAGTSTKVTHLNFSYSGARTSNLINDLLSKAIADQPDLITLLIGTNDVLGNVSQDEFRRNYTTILEQLKNQTAAKINIISIPFLGTNSLLLPPYNCYYQNRIISFNKVIKDLALQNGFNYIDLTAPTASYSTRFSDYYAVDNLHPSTLGYQFWSSIIYDNLSQ